MELSAQIRPPTRATSIWGALALLALSCAACGYQLRGGSDVAPAGLSTLSTITISTTQPEGEIPRLLRRRLESLGVQLVDGADDIVSLTLGDEEQADRPVSVTPRARAAQYETRLSVTMSLSRGTEELLPPETLIAERTYFEDIENISGNREEVRLILSEMRRELVDQIMRRLGGGNW